VTKLWEIDIYPSAGQPDTAGTSLAIEARDLGLADGLQVTATRGFLVQANAGEDSIRHVATTLLADPVTEKAIIAPVGDVSLTQPPGANSTLVHVLFKPGVMDPVALSTKQALLDLKLDVEEVRTLRKYWLSPLSPSDLNRLTSKLLSNDSIEQVVIGPLNIDHLDIGTKYELKLAHVPLRSLTDDELVKLSRDHQLSLSLAEMKTIQAHYATLDRDPTDIELETIAQTWSEHCSHKTLAGKIEYRDENGTQHFKNMLRETIFAATETIREKLGTEDWCVKVFKDNAGIVRFDDNYNIVFKVETHNHPSAIEPYGGSNTGIGGVIRDPLGTGLGAKPICNTDVFCFAPPDTDPATLPPGCLHPRRVMKGVVAGVRDYGNRMGIPTVNGAVYFDRRYLGNPLVYCGNVGILPRDKSDKEVHPGDWIVAIGGRTGRDGIHGATFSSIELTSESESISGGSVQIGNAVMEKMVLDVLLQARDENLYHAVTDCGAGGFSSAVGEMGEEIGAEVWLDRAPLKYAGLSYTEIWISEAQERMVLAVPPEKWERFHQVCAAEGVEATIIGQFVPTKQLRLMYQDTEVGNLSMEFLHDGRPPVVRQATYRPPSPKPANIPDLDRTAIEKTLHKILGSLNVASKHWVIRQYDHEVQGGSVVKPLVGPVCDGPSDAAVVRPLYDSLRGIVISCGMNPHYGDLDPYHMATSAMDEAMRNAICVGADPRRIALLDNFCWGNTDRPETLGTLVRAAIACRDLAVQWETPFISGKDSLKNEFAWVDEKGEKQTLVIPSTLLISAMGQIDDIRRCITMDLKSAGNKLYLVGPTRSEFGGSHFSLVHGLIGGEVPKVDASLAKRVFFALHAAMKAGLVRSCHDLSEGGLAIAAAEMSFAGGLGIDLDIAELCQQQFIDPLTALFSESNSRFLCEVPAEKASEFEKHFDNLPISSVGHVTGSPKVKILANHQCNALLAEVGWNELKQTWLRPLDW
jgi:phosphoribosylformylglycinamidine synthase